MQGSDALQQCITAQETPLKSLLQRPLWALVAFHLHPDTQSHAATGLCLAIIQHPVRWPVSGPAASLKKQQALE